MPRTVESVTEYPLKPLFSFRSACQSLGVPLYTAVFTGWGLKLRILLVEDDHSLGQAVLSYLQSKQFLVDWAESLQQARAFLATMHYAAVLLDLNLPDGEGLGLLTSINGTNAPAQTRPTVIVVTAREHVSDRIRGLDAGADDYLVKPYDPEELLARLRAIERRRAAQVSSVLRSGEIAIDLSRESVRNGLLPVVLTPKEWALLRVLASRPGQIFTRERLQEALYQWDASSDSNTLEVFVSRLRRKLGSALIETVRGTGYRLVVQ